MNTIYIATVHTHDETIAIADTANKAKRLALKSAWEYLRARGVFYESLKNIEEELGCYVRPMELNSAKQE